MASRVILTGIDLNEGARKLREGAGLDQIGPEAFLALGELSQSLDRLGLKHAYRPESFPYIRWCSDDPATNVRVGQWLSLSLGDLRDGEPLTAMITRPLYDAHRDYFEGRGITAQPSTTALGDRAEGNVEDGDVYVITIPGPAGRAARRINHHLKAAISAVLEDADCMERLALLAGETKPETAFRDAVFLALRSAGIACHIEARADSGGARTDLVIVNPDGSREAVEFKFWLAPDLRDPAKIARDAQADWDKHAGDVTLVTVVSSVRSIKYFLNCPDEHWQLDVPRALVAGAVGAVTHWQASRGDWVVDVAR